MPQRKAFAAELRRQIEFQQELTQCLDPALVDGLIALLSIQLREVERGLTTTSQPAPPTPAPPTHSSTLILDSRSEAAMVHLLMAVVTVDGLTKNVELRRLRDYFQERLGYSGDKLLRIDGLVHEAQEHEHEVDVLTLARPFLERSPEERLLIYSACTDIAFSDDEMVEEEQELLDTLARFFQISTEQSAELQKAHWQASMERQQAMELKVRGQFPLGTTVRFESREEPAAETVDKPASPAKVVASDALIKTVELMAVYLSQKKGRCAQEDPDWSRLWIGCPEVVPPELADLLPNSPILKASTAGQFELARALDQRELVEARLFSFLVVSNKPVSVRLVARASKSDPERALQLLLKYVRECAAFVTYGYGCGTWFGLTAWGRRGYEETVRQNLGEIRKQLEQGGKSALTPLEVAVLVDVAGTAKDRALLELAS